MNKYFLPIYHSQLKPWIKFWLLKRLKPSAPVTLKAVTISEGTLTKVDKSKALSIKEYYGNTVQDGTPTPDSPVPVQTISGNITFNINSVNYSLNLKSRNICPTNFSDWESGGYDTGGNKAVATDRIRVKELIPITPNTTYYLNNFDSNDSFIFREYNSNKVFIKNIGSIADRNTFTTSANGGYISITLYSSTGQTRSYEIYQTMFENGDIKPLICLNSETDKTYEEYYNYELCKIGDYKDKIYNDNGTWKIEKKVGKVVLNGTESFTSGGGYVGSGRFEIQNYSAKSGSAGNPNCLCNYYKASFDTNNGSIFVSGVNNWISIINKSYINNLEGFKTWLSENNPNVYYIKTTPTTETITNTNLISQLNALYEFYVGLSTVSISNDSEITLEVLLEYYGR